MTNLDGEPQGEESAQTHPHLLRRRPAGSRLSPGRRGWVTPEDGAGRDGAWGPELLGVFAGVWGLYAPLGPAPECLPRRSRAPQTLGPRRAEAASVA